MAETTAKEDSGFDVSQLVDAGVKAYALYQEMSGKPKTRGAKGGRPKARDPWKKKVENISAVGPVALPCVEAMYLGNVLNMLTAEEVAAVVANTIDNQASVKLMHSLPTSPDWAIASALKAFGSSEKRIEDVRKAFDLSTFLLYIGQMYAQVQADKAVQQRVAGAVFKTG